MSLSLSGGLTRRMCLLKIFIYMVDFTKREVLAHTYFCGNIDEDCEDVSILGPITTNAASVC